MKSKESVCAVQGISAVVFGYLAFSMRSSSQWLYNSNDIPFWLGFQFLTEAIGQVFLALSAMNASQITKYRYFEWNTYGHVAWVKVFSSHSLIGTDFFHRYFHLSVYDCFDCKWNYHR